MMMSKFTKGLWNIGEINPLNRMQINPSIGYVYIDPDNPEEGEAKARLICAAPEMYWLLKELGCNDLLTPQQGKDIEALLAKIDGENEGGE